jgi:flagellar hook-length control protein FliK
MIQAQGLLSETGRSHPLVGGGTRASSVGGQTLGGNSRAVGVEFAPGRAEFAERLTKAQAKERRKTDPAERADKPHERKDEKAEAADSASDAPADAAEASGKEPASKVDKEAGVAGGDPAAATAPTGDRGVAGADAKGPSDGTGVTDAASGGDAESAVQDRQEQAAQPVADVPSHPRTAHELAVALTTRPPTITVVNEVLLQGGTSPRFALVAPQQRPGAVAPASDGRVDGGKGGERGAESGPGVVPGADAPGPAALATGPFAPAPAGPTSETPVAGANALSPPNTTKPAQAKAEKAEDPRSSAVASAAAATPTGASAATPTVASSAGATAPAPGGAATQEKPTGASPIGAGSAHRLLDRLAPGMASVRGGQAAPGEATAFAAQLQRGLAQAMQQTVAAGAGAAVTQGGAVVLRLQPAALGQLKIQLRIEKGEVSARFEATTARARALLEGSVAALRESLGEKGVSVKDIAIAMAPRLPERELGLPPVVEPGPANPAPGAQGMPTGPGASFADGRGGPASGGPGGGASQDHGSATPHGRDDAALSLPLGFEPAVGGVTYTLGPDGRVGVTALA